MVPGSTEHVIDCHCVQLRLTVSGSAACPAPIMQRWEQLSGRRLLERYGMTETGMILGNPYRWRCWQWSDCRLTMLCFLSWGLAVAGCCNAWTFC